MVKNLVLFFVLSSFAMSAQKKSDSKSETYASRKETYQIKYNPDHWIKNTEPSTSWDAEFHDKYNVVNAYFSEYDYFITDKNLKSTIEDQYKDLGEIKNLKIFKKKINGITVSYFTCELEYNDYLYKYQGFTFNGKGGSIQMQYGAQAEAIELNQNSIDELNNGIELINN